MTEHIRIDKADNILTLTLARPDKKNALTNAMYGVLTDALHAAEADPAVRVIVIRGEGDMFTAGNDVGEFAAIATGAFKGERHVARFVSAIASASSCSFASGTTRLARPSASAVLASTVSPSANIS